MALLPGNLERQTLVVAVVLGLLVMLADQWLPALTDIPNEPQVVQVAAAFSLFDMQSVHQVHQQV
jgi:hypothetical protein